MLFVHLKGILKLYRLRLRAPKGAHDEFLLAATAPNLLKMAKLAPLRMAIATGVAKRQIRLIPRVLSSPTATRIFQHNLGNSGLSTNQLIEQKGGIRVSLIQDI